MKFPCENCANEKCHNHNYGYSNNCFLTAYADDPEKCEKYITSSAVNADSSISKSAKAEGAQ